MPPRLMLAAGATAVLVALGGCASPPGPSPYAAATAAELQQSVLHVTESAGEGDFAAARARLDELEVDTKVAFARGELTAARRDSILAAIALVRADLEAQLAAAQAKAEAEAEAERQKAEDEAREAAEAKAAEEARQAAEAEAAAEAERQAAEREAAERAAETSGNSGSGGGDDEDDDDDDNGNGEGKNKGKGGKSGKD